MTNPTDEQHLYNAFARFASQATVPLAGRTRVTARLAARRRHRRVAALAIVAMMTGGVGIGVTHLPKSKPSVVATAGSTNGQGAGEATIGSAPDVTSAPPDPNLALEACLTDAGAPYRRIPNDSTELAFGPVEGASDAQGQAFSQAMETCFEREGADTSDGVPQEVNRLLGARYAASVTACLQGKGYDARLDPVPDQPGAWSFVTPGVDQGSAEFDAAVAPCTKAAHAEEAATRVSLPRTDPTLEDFSAPPGMMPVVDEEGHFAGYADADVVRQGSRASGLVNLGSKHQLDGEPVTDRNGALTGYLIAGLGFVTKHQASSPSTIDRLHEDRIAARADATAQFNDRTSTTQAG